MSRRPAKPAPVAPHALDRLEQVRVLAHPLRLRLLELFAEAPRTTKQAADHLGEPPTRLYHHVAALERVGLVRVRETRKNRGTIEKHYEAVARAFEMDPSRFARGRSKAARDAAGRLAGAGAAALAQRVIERTGDELAAAIEASHDLAPDDPRRPLALGAGIVAAPAQIEALRDDLLGLLEGFQARALAAERAEEGRKKKPGAEETLRAWLTIVLVPESRPGERKPVRGKAETQAAPGPGSASSRGGHRPAPTAPKNAGPRTR